MKPEWKKTRQTLLGALATTIFLASGAMAQTMTQASDTAAEIQRNLREAELVLGPLVEDAADLEANLENTVRDAISIIKMYLETLPHRRTTSDEEADAGPPVTPAVVEGVVTPVAAASDGYISDSGHPTTAGSDGNNDCGSPTTRNTPVNAPSPPGNMRQTTEARANKLRRWAEHLRDLADHLEQLAGGFESDGS